MRRLQVSIRSGEPIKTETAASAEERNLLERLSFDPIFESSSDQRVKGAEEFCSDRHCYTTDHDKNEKQTY